MSFADWQKGLYTGLQQDYAPAVAARDDAWYRACKEIIARCVAPDMYANAMDMLERARREAAGLGVRVVVDPTMPSDQVSVRDASGRELGRIVNVGR